MTMWLKTVSQQSEQGNRHHSTPPNFCAVRQSEHGLDSLTLVKIKIPLSSFYEHRIVQNSVSIISIFKISESNRKKKNRQVGEEEFRW